MSIAKNYLSEEEITELNRIVSMYLDYAEDQAHKKKPMHMQDWAGKLDSFLQFNERNILTHKGRVSHELAVEHAQQEFDKFKAQRLAASQPSSDFDRLVEESHRLQVELPLQPPVEREEKPKKKLGRRKKGE